MRFQIADFGTFWSSLSADEKERVRDKANWEHMTLSAVLFEWPSITSVSFASFVESPEVSE